MSDFNFLDRDSGVSLPSDYSMEVFLSKGFKFTDVSDYRNHVMNHSEFTSSSGMELKTDRFSWNFREHILEDESHKMQHTQFLEGIIFPVSLQVRDFEILSDLNLNWFRLSKHPLDKFYKINKEAFFLLKNKQIIQLLNDLTDHKILIRKQGESLQFRFHFSKYHSNNNRVFYDLLNLIVSEILF